MNCPCCSDKLLQHISRNRLYWYCVSCRQSLFDVNNKTLTSSIKHHR